MNNIQSSRTGLFIETLFAIAIILLYFVLIIIALTPPIAADALIHHLAIPKLWLLNGGFYEIKWADFSYYPMNIDLLYLIPLYFKNDILPNFIHMAFGIGTAWLIYRHLKVRFNRITGLLGVLIFVSTPIVLRMSTVAYVDLGLVFFTTASIFAFVRWRAGNYTEFKWLIISSIAMGLALGTKYNALIAWFFLSTSIVFLYSRDTGAQWRAVRFGVVFFLVSLFVFSPWLIKNLILTGNPLYPLFADLLTSGISYTDTDGSIRSIVPGNTTLGIFQLREMLYGETFWETLLIPVRFFFQGQDYSGRYFDGVLNPVLIVLVPFAFMQRSRYDNRLFFVLISVFFVLSAFFLGQLHIRYILPAIPLLSALAAAGIMNIFSWARDRKRPAREVLLCLIILTLFIFMSRNIIYLKKYFQGIRPMNYVLRLETRDEYLNRHLTSYAAMCYINRHTPTDSKVRLLFLARRGYYLDRIYEDDHTYGMDIIRALAANSHEDQPFEAYLRSLGFTHFLVRTDLSTMFVHDNYPPETAERLFRQINRVTNLIYSANGYAVFSLSLPGQH